MSMCVCVRESMCVVGIEIVHWVKEKECVREAERERERERRGLS